MKRNSTGSLQIELQGKKKMIEINKEEIIKDFDDIMEALWDIDIPSPTVPEYVEHHEQIQDMMKYVGKKIEKYKSKKFNIFSCQWCRKDFYLPEGEEYHFCPRCGWKGITLEEKVG